MHNVELIAVSMRSGAVLSAISAELHLSYVSFTYPAKPSRAPCRVEGSALCWRGRCRPRCREVRREIIRALASCATAVLMGAAVAAPAPIALADAQQLAIER